MRRIMSFVFLMFYCGFCFADSAEAKQCEFNGIPYQQAVVFAAELKQAVMKNQKNKIADLIAYPLRINQSASRHYFIPNKADFIERYHVLFNAKAKRNLLNNKSIFCNYQGGMLGGGFVWYNLKNNVLKIFSINQIK